jgi:hypothetical protein
MGECLKDSVAVATGGWGGVSCRYRVSVDIANKQIRTRVGADLGIPAF